MTNDCKHPITSVTDTQTITREGKTFIVQYLTCVDCHQQCETNIV